MNIRARHILFLLLSFMMLSCIKNADINGGGEDNGEFAEGEPISFTTGLRGIVSGTKALAFDTQLAFDTEVQRYHTMDYPYELHVSMYGEDDPSTPLGSARFTPQTDPLTGHYLRDLALIMEEDNNPIYWQSNVRRYAFSAISNHTSLPLDQSSEANWRSADKLSGVGFAPSFNADRRPEKSDYIDALNFHTNREWKQASGSKAIPLYMRHDRAWVTVILKAGRGVSRSDLLPRNVVANVYSYDRDATESAISAPWINDATVDYDDAQDVPTSRIDAIVEPFDYGSESGRELNIFRVVLGSGSGTGLNFTYKSKNNADPEDLSVYDLEAGKHLTITATLSTDKVVLITALLEDWDPVSMISICDDYGQNGDPIIIKSPEELATFLAGRDNKAGNTALVSATSLVLPDDWVNTYDLKANLNLAGATIYTKKQFINDITADGSVVNGIINITGDTPGNTALCNNNSGLIQQVSVTVQDEFKQTAHAERAGLAVVNYGTIYNCTSNLIVKYTGSEPVNPEEPVYIGGIAAESRFAHESTNPPYIEACTVNSRVCTSGDVNPDIIVSPVVTGLGGIAGYAEGYVISNTFNYGLTFLQYVKDSDGTRYPGFNYKNIIAATASNDKVVHANNNWWPTAAANTIGVDNNNNYNSSPEYTAVLDNEVELGLLLESYTDGATYGIVDDFDVSSDWKYGIAEDNGWTAATKEYNLRFNLDGQNHTITTHGKMLFSHINGTFSNMVINLAESIITPQAASDDPDVYKDRTDVAAALAYSVNSVNAGGIQYDGVLENIRVKSGEDVIIKAAQPAGLVGWAFDGAVIRGCEVQVSLVPELTGMGVDVKRYCGGIVAFSCVAQIDACTVHTGTTIGGSIGMTNLFVGGILGGTVGKNGIVDPATVITDCVSWWGENESEVVTLSNHIGSIVGTTKYTRSAYDHEDRSGMVDKASSGNWWSQGKPVGVLANVRSAYEDVIGYKNNVGPTTDVIDY